MLYLPISVTSVYVSYQYFYVFSHTDLNSRQTLTNNLALIAFTRTGSTCAGFSHIFKLCGSCLVHRYQAF